MADDETELTVGPGFIPVFFDNPDYLDEEILGRWVDDRSYTDRTRVWSSPEPGSLYNDDPAVAWLELRTGEPLADALDRINNPSFTRKIEVVE